MVKKLLKHEFVYYARTLCLFLPIVLVMGVITRVFQLFDMENDVVFLALTSSSVLFSLSCAALLILTTATCVIRFYKNLYSSEGYLTLTLPVTAGQHIFAKLLSALLTQGVCLLTVFSAGCIAFPSDDSFFGVNVAELVTNLLFSPEIPAELIAGQILLSLLSAVSGMLLLYACITVGQTAKKNRILTAVGAYFIYYIASQSLSTIAVVVGLLITGILSIDPGIEAAISTVYDDTHLFEYLYIGFQTLLELGKILLFWIVTRSVMTKKLNLE